LAKNQVSTVKSLSCTCTCRADSKHTVSAAAG
jgi:hypothetical protein